MKPNLGSLYWAPCPPEEYVGQVMIRDHTDYEYTVVEYFIGRTEYSSTGAPQPVYKIKWLNGPWKDEVCVKPVTFIWLQSQKKYEHRKVRYPTAV